MDNNLKAFRAKAGLSQQKLADALSVSRQTIISVEKGRYAPSLPLAFQLAAEFECLIEDLFIPDLPATDEDGE